MRIQYVLESKSIKNAVELIVVEGHGHDITEYIVVIDEGTELGTACTDHVGTEVDKSK